MEQTKKMHIWGLIEKPVIINPDKPVWLPVGEVTYIQYCLMVVVSVCVFLQELDMAYYDSKAELDYVSKGQITWFLCFFVLI